MILWRKNIPLDNSIHNQLVKELKSETFYESSENLYTSYRKSNLFDQTGIIGKYYDSLISEIMSDLSLKERSNYTMRWWAQLYNSNTAGHNDHDHFTGYECVSWVHFVNTPKQKCFYFINDKNEKFYIDHQSSGDFIVFPSWAKHGAEKVIEDNFDRLIVAGNIGMQYIRNVEGKYNLVLQPPKIAHQNLIVWKREPLVK